MLRVPEGFRSVFKRALGITLFTFVPIAVGAWMFRTTDEVGSMIFITAGILFAVFAVAAVISAPQTSVDRSEAAPD